MSVMFDNESTLTGPEYIAADESVIGTYTDQLWEFYSNMDYYYYYQLYDQGYFDEYFNFEEEYVEDDTTYDYEEVCYNEQEDYYYYCDEAQNWDEYNW